MVVMVLLVVVKVLSVVIMVLLVVVWYSVESLSVF